MMETGAMHEWQEKKRKGLLLPEWMQVPYEFVEFVNPDAYCFVKNLGKF